MHAQVDEGAELRHVADRALEHHAGLQVLEVVDAVVEARHLEVGARVAAGLFQLGQDVLDGDGAEALVGEGLGLQRAQHVGCGPSARSPACPWRPACFCTTRVGLGVHAGQVQRVVAVADAQEAGRLLEGLGAQARPRRAAAGGCGRRRCASRQRTMLAATAGAQARHARQQRRRGGVQVHAHRVDAVLDHRVQAAAPARSG